MQQDNDVSINEDECGSKSNDEIKDDNKDSKQNKISNEESEE